VLKVHSILAALISLLTLSEDYKVFVHVSRMLRRVLGPKT
jgi:hypothetical protein